MKIANTRLCNLIFVDIQLSKSVLNTVNTSLNFDYFEEVVKQFSRIVFIH